MWGWQKLWEANVSCPGPDLTDCNPGWEWVFLSGLLKTAPCLRVAVSDFGFSPEPVHITRQYLKSICSITFFQLYFLSLKFCVSQNKLSLIHKPIWIELIDWKYLFLNSFCFIRLLACFYQGFGQDELSGEVFLI